MVHKVGQRDAFDEPGSVADLLGHELHVPGVIEPANFVRVQVASSAHVGGRKEPQKLDTRLGQLDYSA